MNNPLNRSMFRQAGMSKQPMGILASSPELMTTAQRAMMSGQPMKAEHGAVAKIGNFINTANPITSLSPPDPNRFLYGSTLTPPKYGGGRTPSHVERDEAKFRKNAGAQIEGPGIIPVKGPESFRVTQPNVDEFTEYKAGSTTFEDPIIKDETLINKKNKEILDNKKKEETKVIEPDIDFKKSTINKKDLLTDFKDPSMQKQLDQKSKELKIAVSEADQNEGSANALKTKGSAFDEFLKLKEKGDYDQEPIDLGKLRKIAVEQSGIDPNDKSEGAEERKDAFWMSLMKAGLAIASGESSNTMQNVAKGLGFGLEAYGKDIKDLTKQERENKKEYYTVLRDLVKNEESKQAAAKLFELNIDQFNANKIAQFKIQENDIEFRKLLASKDREIKEKNLDLETSKFIATNKIDVTKLEMQADELFNKNMFKNENFKFEKGKWAAQYEQSQKEYKLNVDKFAEQVSQFDTKVVMDGMSKETKQALSVFGSIDPSTGDIKFKNDEEEKQYKSLVGQLIAVSAIDKTSINIKMEEARAVASAGNAGGISFEKIGITDNKSKIKAALIWSSFYQKSWEDSTKIKDPSGVDYSVLPPTDERVIAIRVGIQDAYSAQIKGLVNGGYTVTKQKPK
tara:strand:+ start:303 stop:2174 length:1872 start_codon:yes stop_codon:yes gene_type:complete